MVRLAVRRGSTLSDRITSPRNPVVKTLASLREARARKREGLTRIDGARELMRALDAGLQLEHFVICPERVTDDARQVIERAGEGNRPPLLVNEKVYDELRYGDRDEGLCASVAWTASELAALELSDAPLLLVLEGIEKPGNLGACLRTADAAGVDAVILCDSAIDPSNPNAVRASLGTLFTVPVAAATAGATRAWLEPQRIRVASAIVEARMDYTEANLAGPVAIALGSEHAGLGSVWREHPEEGVRIPMAGRADSLNVSVAAAILLFEARRQRRWLEKGPQPSPSE